MSAAPKSATPTPITRIDRVWMLAPFKKAWERRARETTLMAALGECIDKLLANPRSPGLNLEVLGGSVGPTVLSARIDRSFRLILTPLAAREIGLLYFDNHDEAYRWVDRHRAQIPTMLTRVQEIAPQVPISRAAPPLPVVQADDDAPLAVTSAAQWTRMVEHGVERYLAYLDEEQKRVAELHASGLLLVKGGAGTGKTAVAIHRALWLARLIGADGQLTVLADPAQEIYDCGFQWTQRELRPRGGNTRWLRKTYRTTREIFDLARPLLDDVPDLADDLAQLEAPERRGDRPVALACADASELRSEIVERISRALTIRSANQIGVVATTHQALDTVAAALQERGIRHQVCGGEAGDIRLGETSVKLLTMHSVKGLDFPEVFVLAPTAGEPGWDEAREAECRRRFYVALTRSSDRLPIGLVYGRHHPLTMRLNPSCLDAAGARGREFANTAG